MQRNLAFSAVVGLLAICVADSYGAPIASGNLSQGATVIQASGQYNADFSVQRTIDGVTADLHSDNAGPANTSYWLAPDGSTLSNFTLDLGSSQPIGTIALINTHNAQYNDRGTRTFEIYGSNSVDGGNALISPERVLQGTLTTSRGNAGDGALPVDIFNGVNGLETGSYRYLQFRTLSGSFNGDNVGLNEIEIYNQRISANVAAGKQATASGTYPLTEFTPQAVTDQRIDDFRAGGGLSVFDHARNGNLASYWIGRDATPNEFVTVDLEKRFLIDRIDLQNTHNGFNNERGTSDFRIEGSMDGVNFDTIFSGTLASAFSAVNESFIPFESFSVAGGDFDPFTARYVRFVAEDFYGVGSGLNEIMIFSQHAVPEPGTFVLLGMAVAGLGLRRTVRRAV